MSNAFPSFQYYKRPAIIAAYEPLAAKLVSDFAKERPGSDLNISTKDLASLTDSLQQFQNDVFAKRENPKGLVRIPTRAFKDLSLGGSLYTILKAAYEYKVDHGIRRWEWQNHARRGKYVELLESIGVALFEKGFITYPRVVFARSVPEETRNELAELAGKVHVMVVPHMTSDVTHVVQTGDFDSSSAEDGTEQEWYRTLEKLDGYCLLHYWYKPDSQDVWVPQSSGDFMDPENEEDYEVEERDFPEDASDDESHGSHFGGQEESDLDLDDADSKSVLEPESPSYSGAFSPAYTEREGTLEIGGSHHPQRLGLHPLPAVATVDINRRNTRAKRNEYEPLANSALQNISSPVFRGKYMVATSPLSSFKRQSSEMLKHEPDKGKGMEEADSTVENVKREIDVVAMEVHGHSLKTESDLDAPAPEIILPPSASWFSLERVHEVEKRSFPDLLDDESLSAREEEYIHCRNLIVKRYHQDPSTYLTITECRELVDSDILDLVRIHAFLEDQGLINTLDDYRPVPVSSAGFCLLRSKPATVEESASADALVYQGDRRLWPNAKQPESDRGFLHRLSPDRCHSCAEALSRFRYRSVDTAHFEICEACFVDGKYPYDFASKDFVALEGIPDKASAATQGEWSEEETLALLEGLEMFGEDWDRVAQQVRTRAAGDCAVQFSRMRIEDEVLGGSEALRLQQTPLGNVDNPLMAFLAFLGSAVNPAVASAAAHAALKVLFTPTSTSDAAAKTEVVSGTEAPAPGVVLDAAETALDAAIQRARELASLEERQINLLVRYLADAELEKVEGDLDEMERGVRL
ncbi:SWI SNF, matrix associated, actin dependent regulator of chromatin, sub c, member 2 [Borealophlyctis nickersoniae]|nr:SWI SNF, matrix associated, actin dependent regulator of chromatin, sub c, member 2 [Borealophlyctis nickersoniae]